MARQWTVADIPLPERRASARAIARALAVVVGVVGVLAILPGASGLPRAAVGAAVLAVLAMHGVVGWARWEAWGAPAQERLLLAWAGSAAAGSVVPLLVTGPDDVLPLIGLPVAFVMAGATLRARTFLVLAATTVAASGLLVLLLLPRRGDALLLLVLAAGVAIVSAVVARTAGAAFARAEQDRREAQETSRALRAVVDAAAATSVAEPRAVLQAVVAATEALGEDVAGLYEVGDDGLLRYVATHRISPDLLGAAFPEDRGISGRALMAGRTLVVDDYPAWEHAMDVYVEQGLCTSIGTPIRAGGEVVGVLVSGRWTPGPYSPATIDAFELLAAQAGRALELSRTIDADRRTLALLRDLQQRQRDFVSTVSHELRTPVAIIDGITQTLDAHSNALPPERVEKLRGRLRANATALSSIVTTLLDTTALDRGTLEVERARLRLDTLASGCVDRLTSLAQEHEVALDVAPCTVEADGALLQRVLENLLVNALRHTPEGTLVEVMVRPRGTLAFVHVRDEGEGIPPEEPPTITERFVRGGDTRVRATRGLGIGLALADEILRLHGARLEVTSRVGEGTRFAFQLPLVDPARTD